MRNNTKNNLYTLKQSIRQIFDYPKIVLENVDYDSYWKDKRGKEMGELSDWQIERANFVVRLLKVFENGKKFSFVDIGCGDGSILNFLKEKNILSQGTGIDMSEFALERVRQFGFSTQKEDITDPSFLTRMPTSEYFLLFEILEHIPHSEKMLKEVYSSSTKGVFFSFPNTGFVVHRFRLLFGKFPLQWRLSPGEHVRFWTRADLLWWLHSQDYKNFKIHTYKGVPFLNKIWPAFFAAGLVVFIPK
jgi:2-polyprenyl-3-methyl-5-hydroxy-6-metoxy-1,4-benzoquinol methylase